MTSSHIPRILFVEGCNFINAPLGGQLTAARMLLQSFGSRLALAGYTDDPYAPIGRWHKRVINNIEYDFFAIDCMPEPRHKRPLIPARATSWLRFMRYGKAILSCGIVNILTREPAVIMALPFKSAHNVCFWFPGVDKALSVSRYEWAKPFATIFDKVFLLSVRRHAKTISAAADRDAIINLKNRYRGILAEKDIRFFSTRVDTDIFHAGDRICARQSLTLPLDAIIVITSGRLHRAKGWPLLLDAFALFRVRHSNAQLFFIGDGSDRTAIEQTIAGEKGLQGHVHLIGQIPPSQLALYLQAADLFVMGSEKEGWSTSLLEALASGLPIVTTHFSSADSIVQKGLNGFVVERNAHVFAKAMDNALRLTGVREYSAKEIEKYALANLATALIDVWPLI